MLARLSTAFGLTLMLAACKPDSANHNHVAAQAPVAAVPAVPVIATRATAQTLPVDITAIGTVEAYATIRVKPQVGGQIMQVHFTEGQEVKAGDPLFTIDPRPYDAALKQAVADRDKMAANLKQAEAGKAKDEALARNAQADVARYASVPDRAAIAQETVEKAQANADALLATVRSDAAAIETARQELRAADAAVENARLQLNYCSIKSPINGRTGNLEVDMGNIVKANPDDGLVTLNQLEPIYVTFSVPEQYLNDVRRAMAKRPLEVIAILTHEEDQPATGTLTFIDNEVDRQTGTIRFKATYPNQDHRLWPGQFADVRLRLSERVNAVAVPSSVVLTGQQGNYCFVINADQTVAIRPLRIGIAAGNLIEIVSGLKAGEQVVMDGQVRLRPGVKVEIKSALQSAAATAGGTAAATAAGQGSGH